MYTKQNFKKENGMYFVGDIVNGNGWVDEEQLELLLLEINYGAEIDSNTIYVPLTDDDTDPINYFHLN